MPKYTVTGSYKEYYETTIEAPDEDTAVQIFYQNGGGDSSIDGDWDEIDVDPADDGEATDYDESDYDPSGGKIRW